MLRHGFRALLLLSSAVGLVLYFSAALPTVRTAGPSAAPDSVESAILAQANHLLDHASPYVEPTGDAPVSLMPGYGIAIALLMGADDAQLWIVRQLALLATIVAALLVFGIVKAETGSWSLPFAVATLALVGPALFGAAPGAARPESIALLFALLGFATLRFTIGVVGAFGAGALLSLAFFVHAPALWFVVAAGLSLAFEDRRRCTAFGIAALGLIGVGYGLCSRLLGPWFNAAAWDEPMRALALAGVSVVPFAASHLLGCLAVCTMAAVFSFAISTQPWHERRGLWMWLAVAGIPASLAAWASAPGATSLQSGLVTALVVGAIAIDLVARHLADSFGSASHEGESVIFVAVALQMFLFVALTPTPGWIAQAIAGRG